MILPVIARDSYRSRSFVVCLRVAVSEPVFLRRAKVKPGTYAGNLISRLYDMIFRRSLEFKYDYRKYYAVEYNSFGEYLHKRFLFSPDDVNEISSQFSKSLQIIYFHPRYTFLEDEYGYEFLKKLLEPKESK
jgi:hypothetical protein